MPGYVIETLKVLQIAERLTLLAVRPGYHFYILLAVCLTMKMTVKYLVEGTATGLGDVKIEDFLRQ